MGEYTDKFDSFIEERGSRESNEKFRRLRRSFRKGDEIGKSQYATGFIKPCIDTGAEEYEANAMNLGMGRRYLKKGATTGDLDMVMTGAKHYIRLGKANKPFVVNMLLEAVKTRLKKDEVLSGPEKSSLQDIYDHLKNYEETGHIGGEKDLGSKVSGVVALIGGVFGLFFLSPVLTGNAIANVNQTTSNLVGGVLLLIGLVGVYVSCKCKKK